MNSPHANIEEVKSRRWGNQIPDLLPVKPSTCQQPLISLLQPINEVQNLYFELLRRVRYNLLDGESVVRDLLEWRDLWYSVIAARLPYPSRQKNRLPIDISLLRTTRWNDWPADILYIWTSDENLPELRRLVEERWQADEIGVLLPEDEEMMMANLSDEDNRVLYVWWD